LFIFGLLYFIKIHFKREDDENDLSEDESEQRVNMNFREKIHQERVETRNNFLAYEQGFNFIIHFD
jgi:hypothetical protein